MEKHPQPGHMNCRVQAYIGEVTFQRSAHLCMGVDRYGTGETMELGDSPFLVTRTLMKIRHTLYFTACSTVDSVKSNSEMVETAFQWIKMPQINGLKCLTLHHMSSDLQILASDTSLKGFRSSH